MGNYEQCGARNGTYSCQRRAGHDTPALNENQNKKKHAAITVSGNRPSRLVWGDGKEFWTSVEV